ncbi:MAG: hypothetical protein ACKVZJ_11195 [Phycisphaerales bacterium]
MFGLLLFILGLACWTLAIVLIPAALTAWAMGRFGGIDSSVIALVSTAVGVGVGWVIGRATYHPVVRWLDPTPRCKCGYDIRGLESGLCPECGEALP